MWCDRFNILFVSLLVFSFPYAGSVYAQCASPAGVAGEIEFDATGGGDYEYCDGTSWISMDAGTPSTVTLVGHWRLDETSGSSIADSAGSNTGTWNDGADDDVTGETITGQIGNALDFDGNDDYVEIADDASLDITGGVTVSAWIQYSSGPHGGIVCKQNANNSDNANYCLHIFNGEYAFSVGDGSDSQYARSGIAVDTNWHHFVGTADNSNIVLYVDGVEIYREAQTRTLTTSTVPLFIGIWQTSNAASSPDINIDDARVYDGAMNAEQVYDLYLETSLQGYWRLDETSGTTASDSSDAGNDGTMSGGLNASSDSVAGQVGNALDFDGNDYITAGGAATNVDDVFNGGGTIAYWIYPTSWGIFGRVLDKSDSGVYPPNSGWHSHGTNNRTIFTHAFSTSHGQWEVTDGLVPLNQWTHIAVSYDNSSTSNDPAFYVNGELASFSETSTPSGSAVSDASEPVTIGARQGGAGNFFTGRVDDVRIYNRSLTAAQVSGIYGQFNLVSHWKMDETSGSTIVDSEGANNGTWNDNADNDVTGESVSGALDNAITFDGTDDYVQIPDDNTLDLTSSVSLSAWVRHLGGDRGGIVCKQNADNSNNTNYCLYISTGITYSMSLGDGTNSQYAESGTAPPDTDWHHLVGVADGESITLYLDGVQIYQETQTRTLTASTVDLYMGTWEAGQSTRSTNSSIDDVRIFSNALSPVQVIKLYNCRKARSLFYNSTDNVMQWCDADNVLHNAGAAGAGGGGCSASGSLIAGSAGAMQYDTISNKMVFCDGANWVNIPN